MRLGHNVALGDNVEPDGHLGQLGFGVFIFEQAALGRDDLLLRRLSDVRQQCL